MTDQQLMSALEIETLWQVGHALWPSLFDIPTDPLIVGIKIDVWRDVLGDINPLVVRRALIATSANQYPPSPGALRLVALRLRSVEAGEQPLPDIDQAWAEVNTAIGRIGYMGKPEWSHPAVADGVRAIGWEEICMTLTDQMSVVRGQFARFYAAASERHVRDVAPMPGLMRGAPERAELGE